MVYLVACIFFCAKKIQAVSKKRYRLVLAVVGEIPVHGVRFVGGAEAIAGVEFFEFFCGDGLGVTTDLFQNTVETGAFREF